MELNREQIIKAFSHCNGEVGGVCGGCPLRGDRYCAEHLRENILSLINELTEENERLRAEVSVKKKLLDKCVYLENTVKVDTVRKMQDKVAMHFGTYTGKDVVKVLDVVRLVNQIAEEILEGI